MSLQRQRRAVGRPPASTADDTRERIMAAAERLFARHGYDQTSTKDIAEAADLTPPALYHYFDSKETLFVATLEDRASKLMVRFEAGAASQGPVVDKLCAILDVSALVNREDEHLASFVLSANLEAARNPSLAVRMRSERRYRSMHELLAEILLSARRSGELKADIDLEALTNTLDVCVGGMARFAALTRTPRTHERAIEMFKCLLRDEVFDGARRGA
ncbi:MAG: TetR/AcrR family transcriptional regulator [Acidimicrobiales bacterium]